MNDTGGNRRWRLAWPRRAGLAAVLAGIALLTVACAGGSSSDPGAGGSTNYAKALAYSECMRAHGVSDFPDPNSDGTIAIQAQQNGNGNGNRPDLNSAQAQSADKTCRHLLPNGGQLSPAQRQQAINRLLQFSECMRTHGVPNYPDPTVKNNGSMIGFEIKAGSGVDPNSPAYKSAQQACQSLMPGPKGGPPKGGSGSGNSGSGMVIGS